MSQVYPTPTAEISIVAASSRRRTLRGNYRINDALRRAYRKYDCTKQTRSLLRRYLTG